MSRTAKVFSAVVVALLAVLSPVGPGPVHPSHAAEAPLAFTAPTGTDLHGTVDLEVRAPADTTAVRFFVDDIQLSEITDVYAKETKTPPVWRTATDAGWFTPGRHTLRAVADRPSGPSTVTKSIVTEQPASPPGVTPLNGGWHFSRAADLPAADLDGDSPPVTQPGYDDAAWTNVIVPDSYGAVEDSWNDDNGQVVVYRRTVDVTRTSGLVSSLTFDSCYWSCRYFVNGTQVGTSEGGYLPAHVDATKAIHQGSNTVAVVVDNRKSSMGVFATVHNYYWNWGGLLQQVQLEQDPDLSLTETRAQGAADGTLTLRPTGVNAATTDRTVSAVLDVTDPSGRPAFPPRTVSTTIPAGGGQGSPITVNVAHPELWDLAHPNLYTVHLRPTGAAAWRDISEQTGFRTVSVDGPDLLLNGKPVEDLQGFDRHTDYPGLGRTQPDGLADREIKQLHEKGFRIFRPAHYPSTPAELHAADKYGLLVIEEINVTGMSGARLATQEVQQYGESQLTKEIARDRSHPSVFAFSVGNENRTDQDGARSYIADVIGLGRKLDPSRLYLQVTLAGIASSSHGLDKTLDLQDFVAQNYYAGGGDGDVYPVLPMIEGLRKLSGNKPVLLSEYGVETVLGRPGYGVGTEYFQANLVDEHNRLLDHLPHFIGKMYWTSTEFWCTPTWSGGNPQPVPPYHTKALMTYNRQPKLAWRVMFSPIRIWASTLDATPGKAQTLHERVRIEDVKGRDTSGTLHVTPPAGYSTSVTSQPFHVPANGSTTVDVDLHGTLPLDGSVDPGMVRAVVDSDTEAAPRLLQVTAGDTTVHPASDDFSSSTLDSGWEIGRPDASGWSLTDRPGSLRLSTLPGTEEGTNQAASNVFVRDTTPDVDYTAEAQLHAATNADGQQLALYAYADHEHFVKVGIAQVDGQRVVRLAQESGGVVNYTDSRPLSTDHVWVRLVRRGSRYTAAYSPDGTNWYAFAVTVSVGGTARLALQAEGGSSSDVIDTYVDGLTVLTSGAVTASAVSAPSAPMLGGKAASVNVTLANGTDHAVPVDVGLDVPSGWSAGTGSATLPAFGTAKVSVPVTPPVVPQTATAKAVVTATGADVIGAASAQLTSVPSGDAVPLALDGGCATSPVLSTYRPLTPDSAWSEAAGYGWVDGAPTCRDRGTGDVLGRDFVAGTTPATLRVAVPSGKHEVYLLFGDQGYIVHDTTVTSGGATVTHSGDVPAGQHVWTHFTVDGGSSGSTVDLTFTPTPGEYWSLDSLVVLPT